MTKPIVNETGSPTTTMDTRPISPASPEVTKPIIVCHGEKGGTGKSASAGAVIDGHRDAGQPVHIIDADGGLSDTAKIYGAQSAISVATEWDVEALYEELKAAPVDRTVVVSMPGNVATVLQTYGAGLFLALPELAKSIGRPIIILWTVDNKRDGLESLRRFRIDYPGNRVYVVRNLFFGPDRSFSLLNNSNELASIIADGGKIVDLPALATRVKTKMTNSRWPVDVAREKLEIFDRYELDRWWAKTSENFKIAGLIP